MSPSSPRIAIVDYGAGNLRSVAKALERSALQPVITDDPAQVRAADGLVLPGVGAFADAVTNLRETGLSDSVLESIEMGHPYLGLCLGLQVLFDEGDEYGCHPGLGLIAGRVERFPDLASDGQALCVPHIGWNRVHFRGDHPMLEHLPEVDCFYFVHSYCAVPRDPRVCVGTAEHGGEFTAAAAMDGVFAVQFHPEKSQHAGKRVIDAYATWLAGC